MVDGVPYVVFGCFGCGVNVCAACWEGGKWDCTKRCVRGFGPAGRKVDLAAR